MSSFMRFSICAAYCTLSRMNFAIALPAAIVTMVVYFIVGGSGEITGDLSYNILLVIPYFYVLIAAIAGMNVYVVLTSGIVLAAVIGIATGNISLIGVASAVGSGMEGMMSMSVLAMLIAGLIGIVEMYGGIEWLMTTIEKHIKTRKGAEYSIGILSALLDTCVSM